MKKCISIFVCLVLVGANLHAQLEPNAGNWKTWFIKSGKEYRLPAPSSYKEEVAQVISKQQNLDSAALLQIIYWNAGSPGYRWQEIMATLWQTDISNKGALSHMLLGTSIYDATVAAWDTKYAFKRPRPFAADKKIKLYGPEPESPSYPCEYSVAAGAAVAIITHFYPNMADTVKKMAEQLIASRIAAGIAFPSDTRAGFDLGKTIALKEIENTKDLLTTAVWDKKMPEGPGVWTGKNPMMIIAGLNKPVVLESAKQFRPGPPPEFAKEMAELKSFKQTFRSQANAWHYASQNTSSDILNKKMFEYNLNENAPRAARIYAITAVTFYDVVIALFDAKYAYWGIRPDQYDTTYKPLVPTPPFPGYPSGHAGMSGVTSELFSYFFPTDRAYFQRMAKDGAESRFQAGIHFRSDNEAGLDIGRKVAEL